MGDSCPVGPSGQHHNLYEHEFGEVFRRRDSRVSLLLRGAGSGFLPRMRITAVGTKAPRPAPPSAGRIDCEGNGPLTEGQPSAEAGDNPLVLPRAASPRLVQGDSQARLLCRGVSVASGCSLPLAPETTP